jgi:hypothetical protein
MKYIKIMLLFMLLLNSGCMSVMSKRSWNGAQETKAVRIEADGNQVMVGIDLTTISYIKEHPFRATAAALADGAIGYGLYKGLEALNDDSESSRRGDQGSNNNTGRDNITINGDNNEVTTGSDGFQSASGNPQVVPVP